MAFRHVQSSFWPTFCASAGVFCMGEVFGGTDIEYIKSKIKIPNLN